MSKENKTYFTLIDGTTLTYPLTAVERDPEILEVCIKYKTIKRNGSIGSYTEGNTKAIHVPRSLFKEHGLCLTKEERKEDVPVQSTIEDLLLQLLDQCGVYDQR